MSVDVAEPSAHCPLAAALPSWCPRGMETTSEPETCDCGGSHTSNLSREEARDIARILFAARQESAALLAGEAAKADAKGNRSEAKP